MRYFRFNEQGPDDLTPHIVVTMSEDYLLRMYWPYWRARMERIGKAELATPENCIEDFCTVHWAWEVK